MTPVPTRVPVAGLRCSTSTIPQLLDLLRDRLTAPAGHHPPLSVLCVNAHVFNLAWQDARLHARLEGADVVALDGMAMVWAARRTLGDAAVQRCNMTDALHAFLDDRSQPPVRVLVIGLDDVSVRRAGAAIAARAPHCEVVGGVDGYAPLTTYRAAVADTRPDLVMVGCGTPRSEEVVEALAADTTARVVWHVGGGTLNFLAGNLREAPSWMRRWGLQWLHRLLLQPGRMWRRYLVGNPTFVWRVWRGRSAGAD